MLRLALNFKHHYEQFKKNKADFDKKMSLQRELEIIEKKIDETKDSSPCEAAMYTLMRAPAKQWLPPHRESCRAIVDSFHKLAESEEQDIEDQFKEIYPNYIKCMNGRAIAIAMDKFGKQAAEVAAHQHAEVIEINTKTLEICQEHLSPVNILKQQTLKEQIKEGREMADNLLQFRLFHYRCRAEGQQQSRDRANEHIDLIKSIAKGLSKSKGE